VARPLPSRLTDPDRVKAWPLLTYTILTGQLNVDLDLLVVNGAWAADTPPSTCLDAHLTGEDLNRFEADLHAGAALSV